MSSSTINEINQIVIEFQSGTWDKQIIVLVEDEGCPLKIILTHYGSKSPISTYSAVELVCQTRAPLTVRKKLILNGCAVTPEQYLRHWRKLTPIKPTDFMSLHGVGLVAKLQLDMEAERKNKWGSSGVASSITEFSEFESKYSLHNSDGMGCFDMCNEEQAGDFLHFLKNRSYSSAIQGYPLTYEILVTEIGSGMLAPASQMSFLAPVSTQKPTQQSLF